MGHTEMLLAVAGLENDKIAERCEKLARGDWADFPAAERAAFVFALKQAKTPWTIDNDDVRKLIDHFGRERALDVIWWTCRCHFMTRVADAFQLPLERDNVFQPPKAPPKVDDKTEAEK
jgi:alkylhydroperoxidase family enzyme